MKLIILSFLTSLVFVSTVKSQTVTLLTGFNIPNSVNANKYDIYRINDNAALINMEIPKVLWRTDGTKTGSYILHDWTNEYSYGFYNNFLGVVNDKAIMLVPTDSVGKEIWVSDGTVAGTNLLIDFIPGKVGLVSNDNQTNNSIIINNQCYFLAIIDKKYQIMKTDGTINGTEIYMKDLVEVDYGVSATDMPNIYKAGNYFYFVQGEKFFKVDYLNKLTTKLDMNNGLDIIDLEQISDTSMIFILDKFGNPALESFNTNSNVFENLKNFGYTSKTYPHKILNKFNNAFYFTGKETNWNIYKTDGTISGTKTIASVNNQVDKFIVYNNKLWFENFDNTFYAIFSLNTAGIIKKELDSQKFAGGTEKGFQLLDNNKFFLSGSFIQTGYDWEPHIYDPLTGILTEYNINTNFGSYPELVNKLKDNNYLFLADDDLLDGSLFLLNLKPTNTENPSTQEEILVYPNPADASWTIETKNLNVLKSANYRIMNALGLEVKTGSISNAVTNIDATLFKSGVYFLEIQSKEGQQTIKLVKE